MGGPNSGRRPGTESVVRNLMGFNQPAETDNAVVYLPNYSGIKDSVRKDFASGWTAGSVVFVGATGDFTQDNANLFWDNSNNRLGIGTTSPAAALDLNTGQLAFTNSFKWGMSSNIVRFSLGNNYPSGYKLDTGASSGLFIGSSGNVGIGTASPSAKLHLAGTSGANSLYLSQNSSGGYGTIRMDNIEAGGDIWYLGDGLNSLPGTFIIRDNGASAILALNGTTGNVGIGTTTPQEKLEVSGGSIFVKAGGVTDAGLAIARSSSTGRSEIILGSENLTNSTQSSTGEFWRFGMTGAGGEDFAFFDGTRNSFVILSGGTYGAVKTTAPTFPSATISGGCFISGGAGNAVELWFIGYNGTQVRVAVA